MAPARAQSHRSGLARVSPKFDRPPEMAGGGVEVDLGRGVGQVQEQLWPGTLGAGAQRFGQQSERGGAVPPPQGFLPCLFETRGRPRVAQGFGVEQVPGHGLGGRSSLVEHPSGAHVGYGPAGGAHLGQQGGAYDGLLEAEEITCGKQPVVDQAVDQAIDIGDRQAGEERARRQVGVAVEHRHRLQ